MTIIKFVKKFSSLSHTPFVKNHAKNLSHWTRFPAEVREWLTERTGKTSVPQIFFNAKHVGGNEDLQSLVADEDRWRQEVR